MVSDSILSMARSLHVPEADIPLLRAETLHWLEDTYRDDTVVAKLHANEISRQARDFVHAHGSKFFQIAVEDKIVTGLNDERLFHRVARMMSRQVRTKLRTVNARNQKSGVRPIAAHDADETGSASGMSQDSEEDLDYQPSIRVPRSPLMKSHNTRMNAQPGMPIHRSIEVHKSDLTSTHPIRQKNKRRYSTLLVGAVSGSGRDGMALSLNRFGQHEERTCREFRDYTTPPPLEKILTWKDGPRDADQQNQGRSRDCQVDFQRSSHSRNPQAAGQGPNGNDTVIVANSSQIEPDPLGTVFDRIRSSHNTQKISTAGLTATDWRSSPVTNTNKTPRCERTPPGSGRSELISRLSQLRRHKDGDENGRVSEREKEMRHTDQPDCKIYLGGDHFKVIDRHQADQALQSVFDVLNDFSRDCQIRCRNRTASHAQQRLEERVADSICQLLRRLRNSTQIWEDVEIAWTKIELL